MRRQPSSSALADPVDLLQRELGCRVERTQRVLNEAIPGRGVGLQRIDVEEDYVRSVVEGNLLHLVDEPLAILRLHRLALFTVELVVLRAAVAGIAPPPTLGAG